MLESEADWFTRPYPADLLHHVEFAASRRKLRLFACHCCQRLGPLLGQGGVREALLAAERFADGLATEAELRGGWSAVRRALAKAPLVTKWERALEAALHACSPDFAFWSAMTVSREAARARDDDWHDAAAPPLALCATPQPLRLDECAHQCAVLRDLFAFQPVEVPPGLLAWEGGEIVRLAHGLYDGRLDEMPVLADALEEAGCDDGRLIGHARGSGPHFRGCWLLDALTGRG